MAFNRENLISLGGGSKNGVCPMQYLYWNEDGDTVTDSGYFADIRVSAGDQVTEVSSDYTTRTEYYVSGVSGNKATVSASS